MSVTDKHLEDQASDVAAAARVTREIRIEVGGAGSGGSGGSDACGPLFELTPDDPQFARVSFLLPDGTGCDVSVIDRHPYDEFSYYHAGGFLVVGVTHGTLFDSYLNVFTPPFNPDDPCSTAVARDDDSGAGLEARIVKEFPAGSYIIVVTNFAESQYGTYCVSFDSTPTPTFAPTASTLRDKADAIEE